MRIETTPIHRKVLPPWYDTNTACVIAIVFLVLVLVFGAIGIHVANDTGHYRSYVWVPSLLVVLCSAAILSILIRLKNRFTDQRDK